MAAGHDKKCPNCEGAGELLIKVPMKRLTLDQPGNSFTEIVFQEAIRECALCTGTGLVEVDDYWEHA